MNINHETLQLYLRGALDAELAVYEQNEIINRLTRRYNSLGYYKKYKQPVLEQAKDNTGDDIAICMWIAFIACAIIGAIVGFVVSEGFFGTLGGMLDYAVIGAVIGLLLGFIIGAIVGKREYNKKQRLNEQEYAEAMEAYDKAVQNDYDRVQLELAKKKALGEELAKLRTQYNATWQHRDKVYSVGILDPDYRDIYAVSSIYGYLKKGRTRTLGFDPSTGDQGAYNIYENEKLLGRIVTNLEEIIDRLDEVIKTQYYLADGIQSANNHIQSLCGSIDFHMKKVGSHMKELKSSVDSVGRCQEVIAYNTNRSAQELEFQNWMRLTGIW